MNKHVLKFSDAKNKNNEFFCLPEYSILIGHYETTGLRTIFYFAKSHVNNIYTFDLKIGVDPINLCGMSTGL